jgi:hypothetical protein
VIFFDNRSGLYKIILHSFRFNLFRLSVFSLSIQPVFLSWQRVDTYFENYQDRQSDWRDFC